MILVEANASLFEKRHDWIEVKLIKSEKDADPDHYVGTVSKNWKVGARSVSLLI